MLSSSPLRAEDRDEEIWPLGGLLWAEEAQNVALQQLS